MNGGKLGSRSVENQKLDAVIKLPSEVFRPYAGVSTAILVFTKTNSGGTDFLWFYDVEADGWSLDDKRNPLLPEAKLGPVPAEPLSEGEHTKSNLPDVLRRRPAILNCDGTTLDPAQFVQSLLKSGDPLAHRRRRGCAKEPDRRQLARLPRARRERPSDRAAQCGNEFPSCDSDRHQRL
jgi:hypothetical protein